jgi:hypothetical protein
VVYQKEGEKQLADWEYTPHDVATTYSLRRFGEESVSDVAQGPRWDLGH